MNSFRYPNTHTLREALAQAVLGLSAGIFLSKSGSRGQQN